MKVSSELIEMTLICSCLLLLGVFISRGREDALVTKNLVPGVSVYGEKRISVEVSHWNVSAWVGSVALKWFYVHSGIGSLYKA